jgi:hypothetical protein
MRIADRDRTGQTIEQQLDIRVTHEIERVHPACP